MSQGLNMGLTNIMTELLHNVRYGILTNFNIRKFLPATTICIVPAPSFLYGFITKIRKKRPTGATKTIGKCIKFLLQTNTLFNTNTAEFITN